MNRLQSGLMSMLAGCLIVVSSGCMISPENDDTFVRRRGVGASDRQLSPSGFVQKGGVDVEVQAYNFRQGRWDTVATTVSQGGAMAWEGYNWHYWQTPKVRLGREYWRFTAIWGEEDLADYGATEAEAKIRALGDGDVLYTFNDWRIDIPLRDLIRNVNGTEARIRGVIVE